MIEGGCSCGAVRYAMDGAPIFVNACHCRDCQKITGSAFAVNAMIELDRVAVTAGDDALSVSDGETRCGRCATLLWATVPRLFGDAIVFLRAGTLDEAERLAPDAHLFVRSRHLWVSIPEGVPAYPTQPADGQGVLDEAALARVAAACADLAARAG